MRSVSALVWWLTLLLCLTAGPAQANNAPWTYDWKPAAFDVPAADGGVVAFTAGSGNGVGSTDIVAANLDGYSKASADAPEPILDGGYSLTLHLTDSLSGQDGALTFGGTLGGSLSSGGFGVTNVFDDPQVQELTLGGRLYSVQIGGFTPPPLSGQGGIGAKVTVTGPDGPTAWTLPIRQAPEPSALALGLIGAFPFGLRCCWRRGRARTTSPA